MKNRMAGVMADIAIVLCIAAIAGFALMRNPEGAYAKVLWKVLLDEGPVAVMRRYKEDHRPSLPPNAPSIVETINRKDRVELLKLINSLRESEGLGNLALDKKLCEIACYRARIMADAGDVTHDLPGEGGPRKTLAKFGYSWSFYGENVANYMEDESASDVHQRFRESPGHYGNMVNAKYTKVGIGIGVHESGMKFVCELFVAP